MDNKKCFKCLKVQPLSEFYSHPMMADGRLGKCKICAKADVISNRNKNIDYYKEYDSRRAIVPKRIAAHKAYSQTPAGKASHRKSLQKQRALHPRKYAARVLFGNARRDGKVLVPDICSQCPNPNPQGHHENYDLPLEVVWLCTKCHALRHREMKKLGIVP